MNAHYLGNSGYLGRLHKKERVYVCEREFHALHGQLNTSILPNQLSSERDASAAFHYQKRRCHFFSAMKYSDFLQAA